MYRSIETYDPAPHDYHGVTLPACALVEDDDDGVRWLITAADPLTGHWRRAAANGAAGIATPADGGWLAATADTFAATRTERDGRHTGWTGHLFPAPPTWIALRQREHAAPARPARAAGFIPLHVHTDHSALDGLTTVGELFSVVADHGATAVGITDHGTCAGHPAFQEAALLAGINPVFGIEAYLVNDAETRGVVLDTVDGKATKYWHLTLLAAGDRGLRNIWAASTEANRRGFDGKTPRMDFGTLARHNEDVFASTGCLGGLLSRAILRGDHEAAAARLARLHDIFGERLFVEIQAYGTEAQRKVNIELVRLARAHGLPLLAADDSHYPTRNDAERHAVWIAGQTSSTLGEDTGMFNDGGELHVHTADDMRKALDYLPADVVEEALRSTVIFGELADARISTAKVLPLYSKADTRADAVDNDAVILRILAESGWSRVAARPDQQAYRDRLDRELKVINGQEFAGYFMIVADFVRWAKDNGILVGPGRGSGGGSLVAYLTGITEIDPVRYGLSFERFLTPGRTSMPDFDIDFPTSRKDQILDYVATRWGPEHVVAIGTHMRLQSKAVIEQMGRVLRAELPDTAHADFKKMSAIIERAEAGTAGLGLPWDVLWDLHAEELAPYRARYPRALGFADYLVGRLKTYGRHPAGVVISTGEPLTGMLPLRAIPKTDRMVTDFDAHAIEKMGLIKFDFLFLNTLDTVQKALDAVRDRYGRSLDLYAFDAELEDPLVWEAIRAGEVTGCFQIETSLGRKMCRDLAPERLEDLADVITLVRPGPRNSGLSKVYLARRAGHAEVEYPDPRLAEVLGPTQGAMIYQEQVLLTCRIIAGHDDAEADDIRQILGKKQVEKIDAAGRDFIDRATGGGMDRMAAALLWEQMAEFSRYSFGKAHAFEYAIVAYWMVFLKTHFPVQFMAALLSVAATTDHKERIPGFVKEAKRIGVPVLPPDINTSRIGFTAADGAVRYGVDSLKNIGEAAAAEIIARQPYTSVEDFAARTDSRAVTSRTVHILARAGAFDALEPHRAALVARLDAEASGAAKRCVSKADGLGEDKLPCGYDWDSEPPTLNPRNGKTLPKKDPPKKCTTACRRYRAPDPVSPSAVPAYTDTQIGDIEHELFGFYLTHVPYTRMGDARRAMARQQAEAAASGTPGRYALFALVDRTHEVIDRNGNKMAFLTLATEGPDLEAVCFSKLWATLPGTELTGRLVLAEVACGDGLILKSIITV